MSEMNTFFHTTAQAVQEEDMTVSGCAAKRWTCPQLEEEYYSIEHTSGLRILVIPKQRSVSYAMLTVRFGAQDVCFREEDAASSKWQQLPDGIAHFMEHQMFTLADGRDVSELFSAIGADVNAWTSCDKTSYLFQTTEHEREALEILLRFVLSATFTDAGIQKEQGIIAEEIRGDDDNPWERVYQLSMRAMYQEHPIRQKICGTEASIATITKDMLSLCHRLFYRPDNMYLVFCGTMSPEEVVDRVNAVIPTPSSPLRVSRKHYSEPPVTVQQQVSCRDVVTKPLIQINWKDANAPTDPGRRLRWELMMQLLSEMLFSRAGSFYNELFEKQLIMPSYSYGYSITPQLAYHALTGESDDPQAVLSAYWRHVSMAKEQGLSLKDFERCRRVLYAEYVSGFDFPESVAEAMAEAEGNGCGLFDTLRILPTITLQEVEDVLQQVFYEASSSVVILQAEPDTKAKEN